MKSLAYILTVLGVITLGFWAYNENYATQDALKEARRLNAQITAQHQRLTLLRSEWAYLNRPDRLRDLAVANFEALELIEMSPDSFGRVEQIAFPPEPDPVLPFLDGPITDPVEVSSDNGTEEPL
ncbi:MAG: cell division protein FtsL [Proteobacteria bacterium]|nr:MAG: cell division protein FtsL [Pseudomonadota bacterium]